ncbi:MAG: hypothetical protein ACR65R_10185 [Methylomicrobium sp.]
MNITPTDNSKISLFVTVTLAYLIWIIAARSGTGDDTYWHIKVGEWIVTNKAVPQTGIFSYAAADFPWVSHEWLAAVLLYAVFSFSGWPGLIFLATFAIALAMLMLFNFLVKRTSVNSSMIFLLLAYLLLIPHIMPRPHIFALPIMVFWTIHLITAAESQKTPPLALALLMTLWVNMHGSFLIGLAFIVFFAAESIFLADNKGTKLKLAKNWLIFFTSSLFATFLTPHGLDGLLLPLKLTGQTYMVDTIAEWASPNFHGFQPLEIWLMLFIGVSLFKGLKLPIFRLVFILGLLHLSLKSIRHSTDLLSFLAPMVLAEPFAKQLKTPPNFNFSACYPKKIRHWLIFALYVASIIAYLPNRLKVVDSDPGIQTGIESLQSIQTKKVLTALKSEREMLGNVLNSYALSVYMIHEDFPVFIDSRAELYGDKFLKNYFDTINLSKGAEGVQKIIDKYNITWTIFETNLAINAFLEISPNWRKIYTDRFLTIFLLGDKDISNNTKMELAKIKQSLPKQEIEEGYTERRF